MVLRLVYLFQTIKSRQYVLSSELKRLKEELADVREESTQLTLAASERDSDTITGVETTRAAHHAAKDLLECCEMMFGSPVASQSAAIDSVIECLEELQGQDVTADLLRVFEDEIDALGVSMASNGRELAPASQPFTPVKPKKSMASADRLVSPLLSYRALPGSFTK